MRRFLLINKKTNKIATTGSGTQQAASGAGAGAEAGGGAQGSGTQAHGAGAGAGAGTQVAGAAGGAGAQAAAATATHTSSGPASPAFKLGGTEITRCWKRDCHEDQQRKRDCHERRPRCDANDRGVRTAGAAAFDKPARVHESLVAIFL